MRTRTSSTIAFALAALLGLTQLAPAQSTCDMGSIVPGIVWQGTRHQMNLEEFASYLGPIFWMSPDEPVMEEKAGKDMMVPEALPFEEPPQGPVVYYQYNQINVRTDNQFTTDMGYVTNTEDRSQGMLDLREVLTIRLYFIAYFSREEGLGGHEHDVEPTEVMVFVINSDDLSDRGISCAETNYAIGISRVTGESHGYIWFYNVLETDEYVRFPIHMLVEEGKHGMCTDKNGDGIYTPGFDVSTRINDAWGVRDIIRGGTLFTGGYEPWMAKLRRPEHRVFPPLPDDSPLRDRHLNEDGVYAGDNAIYELRPFPSSALAEDELLHHKMEEKEKPGWPEVDEIGSAQEFRQFIDSDLALKSFALSLRYDGDLGISAVFPLFIVKNFEDPMAGGFLVHRIYLKDKALRDFGWSLMYMKSASRWIDPYLAVGLEIDTEDVPNRDSLEVGVLNEVDDDLPTTVTNTRFVMESGFKFRVNVTKSPLPFLAWFTEYWGLRVGLQYHGFPEINNVPPLNYVFEIGAGVF